MGIYRIAQVCLNGHCITDALDANPECGQPFCDKCGAATITSCPSCGARIHGDYYTPGLCVVGFGYRVPAYCYACGEPYPWTQRAIEATEEIIQDEDELDDNQKEKLTSSLPNIISETPQTQVAIIRLKKAMSSAGKFTADALRQFAIDFGCELVKKQLGL